MKRLTVDAVKILHRRVVEASGGSPGIREAGILEGAVNRPFATFGGQVLVPSTKNGQMSDRANGRINLLKCFL